MVFQTNMSVMTLVTYATWRLRPVTAVPSGPLFVERQAAYDDVLSIEHEDQSTDPVQAVTESVELLRRVTSPTSAVSP